MITLISNPERSLWPQLAMRPHIDLTAMLDTVKEVFDNVKASGDEALKKYTMMYDKVEINTLEVSAGEIEEAGQLLSPEMKDNIQTAAGSIAMFSHAQKQPRIDVEPFKGVRCWQEYKPIDKVGLYIPAGSAPLFSSVLMLAVPANVAGCSEKILCSPPGKDGKINPAILYAASVAGVTRIFKVGGIQAIAAMCHGTQTVPQVYKICGPGNRYVTAAKQFATFYGAAIDMPAGPSELLVVADGNADPSLASIDFLAQLEHGADSQCLLISTSASFAEAFQAAISEQIPLLSRKSIIEKAIGNCRIILFDQMEQALDFANCYAPEHLILHTDECLKHASSIRNAGSVFVGEGTPVSAGDYISGTNHVLPTGGYAKAFSGITLQSYMHSVYYQTINDEGMIELASRIYDMAHFEGLDGHSLASTARL
jgi:histidinol dehydrogenase